MKVSTPAEVFISDEIVGRLPEADLFGWAQDVPGEVVRDVAGRFTRRIEVAGHGYYLKLHQGIGLAEILKNWLTLKQPVTGARNEYAACRYLEAKGVAAPVVAAFAESVDPPWSRRSFVLTRELADMEDLETLSLRWQEQPPSGRELRALVMQVAGFARRLHDVGVVHRDFYICHLLHHSNDPRAGLAVLDLHRALIFERVPERWRLRDLAALLFSVLELPLHRRAWLRFVRIYTGQPLRQTFAQHPRFWRRVYRRAQRLQAKARRKGLVPGGG